MGLLSREDILRAQDIKTESVDCPEWGGSVLVRSMSGRKRDEFESSLMERRGRKMYPNTANLRAKLVAWCVVDEAGTRLFTDEDIAELGEHSAAAVNRIYEVAARLCGMSDDDIEEMVADFGETNGSSSSTGSPKRSAGQSQRPSAHSTATS